MNPTTPSSPPSSGGALTLTATDGRARTGELQTRHGSFATPAFMPVATQGTVKGVTPAQLRDLGAEIVLSNTYHLSVRPGAALIERMGGLHAFMGWDGPILTDSGGFQIFSLSSLRKITDEGVAFRSHVDGAPLFLTPEEVLRIETQLGVDIAMVLDECPPGGADLATATRAAERSLAWARRSREVEPVPGQLRFAIVQGGTHLALREQNAVQLVALDFPGYAVGGLSVGEDRDVTMAVADHTVSFLPSDRPRYLMGVGLPEDLIRFVGMGFDMFDCVLPTRNARNGMLFTSRGRMNIRLARYTEDQEPPDPTCGCYTCRHFTRAYLRHLSQSHEMLAGTLGSIHNLYFFQRLIRDMRTVIRQGAFARWSELALARLSEGIPE